MATGIRKGIERGVAGEDKPGGGVVSGIRKGIESLHFTQLTQFTPFTTGIRKGIESRQERCRRGP